jgi:nicotinamidase-related amidase
MAASFPHYDYLAAGGLRMKRVCKLVVGIATIAGLLSTLCTGSPAQTVIDEWATAKFPAPPALKPATIVPNETALLVMDFTKQTCTNERRPRCARSVAKVLNLVTQARSKGAFIVYSVAVPGSVAAAIGPGQLHCQRPREDPQGQRHQDHSGYGYTGADLGAAYSRRGRARGFKVIVPVDGMSSDEVFPELYTAWHLATAARISPQVTLTKFDLIGC